MAAPLVKWSIEVTRLQDLPLIMRRAAKIAMTPPTGPVFISLNWANRCALTTG
jgi:benzoylformate decarboxylase